MVKEPVAARAAEGPSNTILTWPLPEPGFTNEPGARPGLSVFRLPIPTRNKVHIWAASLDVAPSVQSAFEQTLSSSERVRAARFHFAELRDRYIVAHGWLRRLLGGYLSIPADAVEFQYGSQGKPALTSSTNSSELQFNLAHCEAVALVAVACGTPVGIDVERVRNLHDAGELVERFFSTRENSEFKLLPEDQKPVAFFNLWTRKEAWLKATGEGIAHLLASVEVSFLPGTPARLLSLPEKFLPIANWTVSAVSPGPGLAAAVVVAGDHADLECWRWDHEIVGI